MALKQSMDVSFDGLKLSQISERYHRQNREPIPFDFKTATKKMLLHEELRNTEPHNIHYYPGRIFPYIPLFMLSVNDFNEFKGPILDPFAGCGTILLESIINPFSKRIAIGVEKNPIGRLISKVKTTPVNEQTIDELLQVICSEFHKAESRVTEIPEFTNRPLWFSNNAFKKLSMLKYAITQVCCIQDYKDFFWLCFSSTIRRVSKANPYIPPPVVLKPEKYIGSKTEFEKLTNILLDSEDPPVLNRFKEIVLKNKRKLDVLKDITELKNGEVFSEIIWDDAKSIMKGKSEECGKLFKQESKPLESNSVDMVFTSPPYLTAQKYIRTDKLELFCLGYSEREVLALEKSSIGTERVSMATKIVPLGIETIDCEVAKINASSHERAVQVFQYFKEMSETLGEIRRVLRKNSYAIVVIGDNRVLHKNMETYSLLSDAARKTGFKEIVILKDTIRSRSMLTKRNGTGGIIKNEYVIVLKKV
jgi:16S rRNA G966 N2-methylase RsmD